MPQPIRIGNAHGFWGDRIEAAAEMLAAEPDLDYLTLDFLAEVSMSILALQRERDPSAGYARDFVDVVKSLIPYFQGGGRCKIVTNAGGLNPRGCALLCQKVLQDAGIADRTIAVVSGDDVLPLLNDPRATAWANLDTGKPISSVSDRLITMSAYMGAPPIAAALDQGADIVITGRVADPSLTVGPCVHHFGWKWDDWNRLAGATVAGHLIECGAQVTGGISTDWLDIDDVDTIGFPIVEVADDGSCIVTKPRGSGGRVTLQTVKEQLVYEIGDPGRYISPDVTVSFLTLAVNDLGNNRVSVSGASGSAAPPMLKVSATYRDGFRAAGTLTIVGDHAVRKSKRTAESILQSLQNRGITFQQQIVECVGAGACCPKSMMTATDDLTETVLRIAVADPSRAAVEAFTRSLMPVITAGPPGVTGYAEGRPKVHPRIRYWPCLIPRDLVEPQLELLPRSAPLSPGGRGAGGEGDVTGSARERARNASEEIPPASLASASGSLKSNAASLALDSRLSTLDSIATARSGDKGINANIGVIARDAANYPRLLSELTPARVAEFFGLPTDRVQRFEMPNLGAVNFVVHGILANSLQTDAQGKTLGQQLLMMKIAEPK